MTARVVVVDVDELGDLIRAAVRDELGQRSSGDVPALLDRDALCAALDCSLPTLAKLRREPGFPELRLGDAPRFELAGVLAWLRERSQSATPGDNNALQAAENAPKSRAGEGSLGSLVQAATRKSVKSQSAARGARVNDREGSR